MRQFRLLWSAGAQSLLGDQLARVALAVLVYNRTGSQAATAAIYAWTFLPAIVGNVVFGALLDRVPRRRLLVLLDVLRAVLVALMAVSSLPLLALAGLLTFVVLLGAPWKAAESALVVEVLSKEDYPVGLGLRSATLQATQLAGFAVGGLVVGVIGAHAALGVDAATFAISAAVLWMGLPRSAAPGAHARRAGRWLDTVRWILADRQRRVLLGFTALLGLLVVPEGLAAPYAHEVGGGPHAVGLLLAAGPAGVLLGSVAFSRWAITGVRQRLVSPLAIGAGVPILACFLGGGVGPTMMLWALSGACTAYQIQVVVEYVELVDPARRAQAMGVTSAALLAVQGVGLFAGGVLAQVTSTRAAITIAGGTVCLAALVLSRYRARSAELPDRALAAELR